MSTVKCFEDLKTWQMGREHCKEVFRITNYELLSKDYRLKQSELKGSKYRSDVSGNNLEL